MGYSGWAEHCSFYGKYIPKKQPAIPLTEALRIEEWYSKAMERARIAEGEIERAHQALNNLGVLKQQPSTPQFSLSLSGRISSYCKKSAK